VDIMLYKRELLVIVTKDVKWACFSFMKDITYF
jgi:hypothetical protein